MDLKDIDHFNSVLIIGKAFKLSRFNCQDTSTFQQTLTTPVTLWLGKYTNIHPVSNEGFPSHCFNFCSFDEIPSRLPRETTDGKIFYPNFTDYIGYIEKIGHDNTISTSGQESSNIRKISIRNLRGDNINFVMWDDMCEEFNKHNVTTWNNRITKYEESNITHYYLNPDIPDVQILRDRYLDEHTSQQSLEVRETRSADTRSVIPENQHSLRALLQQPSETLKDHTFTCKGTIISIDSSKSWYYISCSACNKKALINDDTYMCPKHGVQQQANYKYNFKGVIADDTGSANFTFFSPAADKLLGISCSDVVVMQATKQTNTMPDEIINAEGETRIFEFRYNTNSWPNMITFIINDIVDIPSEDRPASRLETSLNTPATPAAKEKGKDVAEEKPTTSAKRSLFADEDKSSKKPNTQEDA